MKSKAKIKKHDEQITQIIGVINQLTTLPEPVKKKIGFTVD